MKTRNRKHSFLSFATVRSALAAAVAVTFVAPPQVLAVGTSYWTQTSEAEFKGGAFDNVVATNLGDLKLSRAVKTHLEMDPRVSAVTALAEGPDETVYAGTGPNGIILSLKDDAVSTLTTIKDATHVFSLAATEDGKLLVGTGGEHGRVLRVDPAKPDEEPAELFKAEGVQYVWAVRRAEDGTIFAATGPKGQLFEIKPGEDGAEATHRVLLDATENNLLSLAHDGKDLLYVGTDPNGLVYRVNRKTGESFVVFDAGEAEVSALVLDGQGNLYAGTSEAREEPAVPQPQAQAAQQGQVGRPEADGASGAPIDSKPPEVPKPPEGPKPMPGQPAPIPKVSEGAGGTAEAPKSDSPAPAPSTGASKSETPSPAGASPAVRFDEAHRGPAGAKRGEGATPAAGTRAAPPGRPGPRPGQPGQGVRPAPGRPPQVDATAAGQPRPQGNAVYRVDADGFVTEVFRQPALVLSMVERDGALLLGTGSDGLVYQVRPAADETIVLAKVDPKQVLSMLPAKDGTLYLGLANVGGIASLTGGVAPAGTYTSGVLDATQISRFGNLRLSGALPGDTTLTVSTRSGNVKEPTESSWSAWSAEVPAAEYVKVQSPPARFFQYRLTFKSQDGQATPVVEDVSVAYQLPNLPPQIRAVRVVPQPEPVNPADTTAPRVAAARKQAIGWEVADPNGDRLEYALYYRQSPGGPWILLREDLATPTFEWDTRSVGDGKYEVRVVATDARSNAPGSAEQASRVSDPVTIDNTAPAIGDLNWRHEAPDAVRVDLRAADGTSTVAAVEYAVDAGKDWQLVLPSDNIFDGPEERVSFAAGGLTPGRHQVTVRATDAKGNTAYQSVFVNVENPAAAADD